MERGGSLPSPLVPHVVLFCSAPSLKASRQVSGVRGMLLVKKPACSHEVVQHGAAGVLGASPVELRTWVKRSPRPDELTALITRCQELTGVCKHREVRQPLPYSAGFGAGLDQLRADRLNTCL